MWSSKREKEKDSGEYENKAKQTSRPFIKKKEKKKVERIFIMLAIWDTMYSFLYPYPKTISVNTIWFANVLRVELVLKLSSR